MVGLTAGGGIISKACGLLLITTADASDPGAVLETDSEGTLGRKSEATVGLAKVGWRGWASRPIRASTARAGWTGRGMNSVEGFRIRLTGVEGDVTAAKLPSGLTN